ncbi:amidase [Nevskia ramosa]|uniref:amidase n=1 Tax=Nevskia ramosa TaxID=64002 RepID=UPI0003B7A347|nr:amidase [Nevskia ramosa]
MNMPKQISEMLAAPAHAEQPTTRQFTRRDLLSVVRAAAVAPVVAAPAMSVAQAASTDTSNELIYMSATKLAGLIRAGKVSASEAVEAYIARQLSVNDELNAVVMNSYARARKEAAAADKAGARGDWMGPLHGVPMTIKDSLDTEGVITTGATYGRQQYIPKQDATVVARVRKAGAILLGKTNTPEFTLGGLAGINAASNLLYGSSHNPYDMTRSTSGSSGGAGAIVAAGGAAFDIGSDWGGSIRGPAHNNGIAGIKPTSIRVPRTGHIVDYGGLFDLWQQLGPMTRRVEDLSLITPIISGPDYRDASCAPVPWADPAAVNLKKLKVAFFASNGVSETDDDVKNTVIQAAKWMEGVATSVTEDLPKAILQDLYDARTKLTNADGWAFYKRMAAKWGTQNFSPSVSERMKTLTPISTADTVAAWDAADDAKSRMLGWIQKYDVLLCPVAGKAAEVIDRPASAARPNAYTWSYTGAFNSTGWPVVVVRCGTSADGKLPIGIQIVAAPWREDICLAVASFLESKSGGWKKPPI